MTLFYMLFFFFSSRRRHTRFDCDWSSDVCSSDLDQQLAYFRSIGVGGVDEIHPELDRLTQYFPRVLAIGRPTPDSLASQPHRAVAKPIHGKITAQKKRRFRSGSRRRGHKFL